VTDPSGAQRPAAIDVLNCREEIDEPRKVLAVMDREMRQKTPTHPLRFIGYFCGEYDPLGDVSRGGWWSLGCLHSGAGWHDRTSSVVLITRTVMSRSSGHQLLGRY
jgi:hypothetical protein